jgi:hypothetical protein
MHGTKTYFYCTLLLTLLLQTFGGEAAMAFDRLSDRSTVSLLTIYPRDKAVYAIFGHTAIRVQDPERRIDLVYNYGFFDSSKPNFIYHFVKGETDYILGIETFGNFLFDYARSNSAVDEQVLALSPEERESVFNFLNTNALPENREYRYDYFFDNCTTRPRDIIERHLQATLVYPDDEAKASFRDWVHVCTQPYPWLAFGIDLALGSGADSTVGARQEMFLPVKLMLAFDGATAKNDSLSYPLVTATHTIFHSNDKNVAAYRPGYVAERSVRQWLLSPLSVNSAILLLVVAASIVGCRRKRRFRGLDVLLFAAGGLAGCIVCFICFVSTHPCTAGNWNVVYLHPLHLVAAVFFLFDGRRKIASRYHQVNFILLSVFLLAVPFLPQDIPGAAIPLILSFWIRSGVNLLLYRNGRSTDKNNY